MTRKNPARTTNLNKTLQIDLNDKKGKAIAKVGAKITKAKTKTPKRQGSKKKTPVKPVQGVRRNLSFDDSSLRRTTPRKKMSLATPKKGSKTPKKTPKKNGTGRSLLLSIILEFLDLTF